MTNFLPFIIHVSSFIFFTFFPWLKKYVNKARINWIFVKDSTVHWAHTVMIRCGSERGQFIVTDERETCEGLEYT